MANLPTIEIKYCTKCRWLLRAAWMAQELLSTFEEELRGVTLIPDGTGGLFEVRVNGEAVWSRKAEGRFPEIKELIDTTQHADGKNPYYQPSTK